MMILPLKMMILPSQPKRVAVETAFALLVGPLAAGMFITLIDEVCTFEFQRDIVQRDAHYCLLQTGLLV